MGDITDRFATAFRDYTTAGVPASGAHEPNKAEIRSIGKRIDQLIGVSASGVAFATLAELNAALSYAAGTKAEVFADAVDANKGVYRKLGAIGSGSWERIADLGTAVLGERLALVEKSPPAFLYSASGTPNDIVANAPQAGQEVNAYDQNRLYVYNHFLGVNTADPVMLKVGSLLAAQVVDFDFNAIPARFLQNNGAYILQYYPGTTSYWRVLTGKRDPNAEAARRVRLQDLGGDNLDASVTQTTFGEPAYQTDTEYLWTPPYSFQASTVMAPTIKVDGLPALPINEEGSGAALVPARLQPGIEHVLQYSGGPDPYMVLRSPKTPIARAPDVPLALGLADSALRNARASFLRSVDVGAVPRVLHFERNFQTAAHAGDWKIAHGLGPAEGATYDAFTYEATGKYGRAVWSDTVDAQKAWWDSNHRFPGPVWLNIFGAASTTSNGGNIPALTDCRYLRVTLDLQLVNFKMPRGARFVLHTQHQDRGVGAGGTGKAFNMAHLGTIVDEALMNAEGAMRPQAGFGLTFPPQVILTGGPDDRFVTINNSSPVRIVFDFVPDDAFWLQYGGSEGRADTYRSAPAEYVLQQTWLNMQLQIIHPLQLSNDVPPALRPFGEGRISYLKIERKA